MILYRATNKTNGKQYIGYTSRTLATRKATHAYAARTGSTSAFHNALRKYGTDGFFWEVVSEHDTKEEAHQAEKDLIQWNKDRDLAGYNLLAGGEGGLYVTDKTAWIEKLKKARVGGKPFAGRSHSEETKLKCKEASQRYWESQRALLNEQS